MLKLVKIITPVLVLVAVTFASSEMPTLVWPPAPDKARLQYVGSLECDELSPKLGLLGKLTRLVTGGSDSDQLGLPYDILVTEDRMFMVCQNIAGLIEIDRTRNKFQIHDDKKFPMSYPISLCDGGNGVIFVTDSENGAVYRFADGKLESFIRSGLVRPTGIAALAKRQRLYIVDTGEHRLKIYDYDGKLISVVPDGSADSVQFHYPTFATATADDHILVNDALNYKIKRFDADGNLISEFGIEGDSPGTFSRPKGISVDRDAHVYVVDNLFDNLQIFDESGTILLAIGHGGVAPGQFWSPAGIDIYRDTVFIADTFNNRIQILHYLGDSQ